MSEFSRAVEYLLNNEKGLEENPKDPGGITNFGISLRFLKSIPFEKRKMYGIYAELINEDDIRHLTMDEAKAIYLGEFWLQAPFAQLTNQDLCNYIFDMAVNMGISPAIKCVQRALWSRYEDRSYINDDGILGKETIAAINNNPNILPVIRSERAGDYRVIVANHPIEKDFIDGWLNRAYEG